ncbi:MAG: endonuclease/exonuclease/phosphatase family protein [Bacteroidota bacterium]|nr:endonuclease/exonuclease/phosphatase family protein [Bacteroidota bacterium]
MKLNFINIIFLVLNCIVALCLLMAYLAPYISPADFWPIAFFGLAYPLLVPLNFLMIIYWLVQLKKFVFISVISLLLGINHITSYIQFFPKKNKDSRLQKINIVSFNTHYMGAYDRKNNDTTFFFQEIAALKPDIFCFQEFANLGGNYEKPLFKEFFRQYKNYYSVNADGQETGYGVSLFSRYPIINKGFVERINNNSNLTVFADIVVNNDTIRVVSTHLKSIVFDKEDYQTIQELRSPNEAMQVGQVKHIGSKLKYAFISRSVQAEELKENLVNCPYKVIICGDFNDSPTSYTYRTIRGDLKDAFKESGWGMSRTYIGKMPSFRIDYILHDPAFKSFNYRTHTINFSDHKMISCTIQMR